MPSAKIQSQTHSRGLMLIAAFKLLKGVALLAVGIGALRLLHKDMAAVADHWINAFRVDPHNRYLHWLLAKLPMVDDRKLKELSVGTFIYSAMFLTEGLGWRSISTGRNILRSSQRLRFFRWRFTKSFGMRLSPRASCC